MAVTVGRVTLPVYVRVGDTEVQVGTLEVPLSLQVLPSEGTE